MEKVKTFDAIQMENNYKRVFYIGVPYTIIEIIGLILSTLGFFESNIRVFVFSIVIFHIVYLTILRAFKKSYSQPITKICRLDWVYYLVLMLWSSLFTALVYLDTKDITIYSLVSILVAALYILKPKVAATFYSINFAFFSLLVVSLADNVSIANEVIFKSLVITIIAFIASRNSYKIRYDNFMKTSQLEIANEKLKERSIRDSLTKLYNNGFIFDYLERAVRKSKHKTHELSIMMMDIDDFKQINDEYGHLKGDEVLKIIANILMDETREQDVVSRYGGEEFMIVLTNTDIETAVSIAERIRKVISQYNFEVGHDVTISIGVKQLQTENMSELIGETDRLLYQAKHSGKNQVCINESI